MSTSPERWWSPKTRPQISSRPDPVTPATPTISPGPTSTSRCWTTSGSTPKMRTPGASADADELKQCCARVRDRGGRLRVARLRELAADRQLDQAGLVDIGRRQGGDVGAVAEYGHRVADVKHFVEVMGHVDHRDTVVAHGAHDLEEPVHLRRRERCRGLIEHEDLGVTPPALERTGNRDPGSLRGREARDGSPEIEIVTERSK